MPTVKDKGGQTVRTFDYTPEGEQEAAALAQSIGGMVEKRNDQTSQVAYSGLKHGGKVTRGSGVAIRGNRCRGSQ